MFRKARIRRDIKRCLREIELLEHKRERSQAALIEAILTQTSPSDTDADYFNRFTAQIEANRARIQKLQEELETL